MHRSFFWLKYLNTGLAMKQMSSGVLCLYWLVRGRIILSMIPTDLVSWHHTTPFSLRLDNYVIVDFHSPHMTVIVRKNTLSTVLSIFEKSIWPEHFFWARSDLAAFLFYRVMENHEQGFSWTLISSLIMPQTITANQMSNYGILCECFESPVKALILPRLECNWKWDENNTTKL